jgi:hypothetical protein
VSLVAQISPPPQAPQLPPQLSSPQRLFMQFGAHPAAQVVPAQCWPGEQAHGWPQPSSTLQLPAEQLGVQA